MLINSLFHYLFYIYFIWVKRSENVLLYILPATHIIQYTSEMILKKVNNLKSGSNLYAFIVRI